MNIFKVINGTRGVTLRASVTASATDLFLPLSDADVGKFTALVNDDRYEVYLTQAGLVTDETSSESVLVSGVITTAGSAGLTVAPNGRAFEGTLTAWPAGSKCELRLTKRFFDQIQSSPEYLNAHAAAMPNLKAHLAKVRTGTTSRYKMGVIGNSTRMGYGAAVGGNANGYTGAYANSIMGRLLAKFNAAGITARNNNLIGDQRTKSIPSAPAATVYQTYDPRLAAFETGWAISATSFLGGFCFDYTAGALSKLSFTPAQSFNQLTVDYVNVAAGASFTVDVDGGASLGTTTIAAANTQNGSVTYTVPLGTHTVNINALNTGNLQIKGIRTDDTTASYINGHQFGQFGVRANAIVSQQNPFLAGFDYAKYACDCYIISMDINDAGSSIAIPTYSADMQSAITLAKATGADVILMTDGRTVGYTNQPAYVAEVRRLAVLNDVPLIDLYARQQSYTKQNAVGMMFDGLHASGAGQDDGSQALWEFLRRFT